MVDKNENYSRETKLILKELECAQTIITAEQAKGFEGNLSVGTNLDLCTENVTAGWTKVALQWKKTEADADDLYVCPEWTTSILKEDDMTDNELTRAKLIVRKIFLSDTEFPIEDSDFCYADIAQAERVLNDLRLRPGQGFPATYNTDFNMQTDESFSRIFFHGMCAPLIFVEPEVTDPEYIKYGPFMVDLDFTSSLPIRDEEKFKKFGARIHFDESKMVSAIYDSHEEKYFFPGDDDWEAAKMQAKVTAVTLCTIREHLAQTHLMVSNDASREVVRNLHPEHPIRRLLAIFTYNAVSVNQSACKALVPERCTIHRALPFKYEGITAVFSNSFTTSVAWQPFPDREIINPALKALTTHEESGFPYYNEVRRIENHH